MEIKILKTNTEYQKALKRIDELWDAKPNSREGDELEVLSLLVEKYEEEKYPVTPPDPIDALKFRMEQMELKRSDLAKYLGGRNRATEILNRQRSLTVGMIKGLYRNLHIPLEVLVGVSSYSGTVVKGKGRKAVPA